MTSPEAEATPIVRLINGRSIWLRQPYPRYNAIHSGMHIVLRPHTDEEIAELQQQLAKIKDIKPEDFIGIGSQDYEIHNAPWFVTPELKAGLGVHGGERIGESPVEVDVDPEALKDWLESRISEFFGHRVTSLVKSLELFDHDTATYLPHKKIVELVNKGMKKQLMLEGGKVVSVLDLFRGAESECKYALWLGIYFCIINNLEQQEKNTDFAREKFNAAAIELNVGEENYEQSLQIVNKSTLLHRWLYPDGSVISMYHEMSDFFMNNQIRYELNYLLQQVAQALLQPETQQYLLQQRLLPPGDAYQKPGNGKAIQPASMTEIVQLQQEPLGTHYFTLYVMSDDSIVRLHYYLMRRLGKKDS